MTKSLLMIAVAGGLSALPGQTPAAAGASQSQVDSTAARSTTERPNVSSPGLEKTMTGILMDATCPAIAAGRSDLTTTGKIVPGSTAAVPQNGMTGANAQSSVGSVARTKTEAESMIAGTKARAADRTESNAAMNSGTNMAAQGSGAAVPGLRSRTETAAISSTTAGPSNASATGTTGAAVTEAVPPPQSGAIQSSASVQGPGAPDSGPASNVDSQRARAVTGTDSSVRDKYKSCMLKPATTAFALHSNGQLYVLDRVSNQMVQEQMRNEAFRASMSDGKDDPKWMTVTATGTATSENILTLRSVRK